MDSNVAQSTDAGKDMTIADIHAPMNDVTELLARLDRVATQRDKFALVEVSQVLLTDCAAMIRALDATCTEWANVSQANYQRAKAAEGAAKGGDK